jgi:uncharacterized membrane protein YGL010W
MPKKTADQWFVEYGECHRDGTNKLLHWICIPLIVLSLVGLLWSIPVPANWRTVPYLNWGTLFVAGALLFYIWLSVPLAIGMLLFSTLVIAAIAGYESTGLAPVWLASLVIFVTAWIGQFIGHKIEGKKPAFFQDLQFLLIGPLWLLGFIYRKLGIPY